MKTEYQIFKEKAILVQKYFGKWSTEYYKDYIQTLVNEPELKRVTRTFSDFREANLEPAIKDLDYILQLETDILRKECIYVFLVDSPVSKASIHLYKEKSEKKGFFCYYCSTLKFALKLLCLDENFKEIEDVLISLKE